eukprot:800085-Pyramimonas_sp.AAC.1
MYASGRRLSWESTYSRQVRATRGVLPGCPLAMFCLQLVMLSPFDEFVSSTSSIGRTVDLYVDDITVAVTAVRKSIVESSVEFLA